jgi:hypothetical protein
VFRTLSAAPCRDGGYEARRSEIDALEVAVDSVKCEGLQERRRPRLGTRFRAHLGHKPLSPGPLLPPTTPSAEHSRLPVAGRHTRRISMRVRTLEIRWHDSRPIATCDFQPQGFKKARPASERAYPAQTYRLATGGEDNHVRVSWCSSRVAWGWECATSRGAQEFNSARPRQDSPILFVRPLVRYRAC